MNSSERCVIIGASLAGGHAAAALRGHGFTGHISLIGAEPERPYQRPPLSKDYLQSAYPEHKLYLWSHHYLQQHDITFHPDSWADGLDTQTHTVTLRSGEQLHYDKLLIATGCQVRRLSIPGADLDGVLYLRTLQDARRLADQLGRAERVVVVGAGFIGSEVAASARVMGKSVTMLEGGPVPLVRALGAEMGAVCAAVHWEHGVDLRASAKLAELRGTGRVEAVALEDGQVIPSDLVVVGIGVSPAVEWLSGSSVAVDNGVLVDEFTQTNLPGVFAAGDVANCWNPSLGKRLRVEHFMHAEGHGIVAGKAMAGLREPYTTVPYFWSEQYDLLLQYVGHADGDAQLVVRGDVAARSFTAFYMEDDRLCAAFSIGRPQDIMAARCLIRGKVTPSIATLTDEGSDLRALSAA